MIKYIFKIFFYVSIILFTSCKNQSASDNIAVNSERDGIVIGIIDGDTYDLLLNSNKTIRIRMDGIDAPEKGMPFYKVSKTYLSKLCFKKSVRILKTSDDNHGRVVAKTYLEDGSELGEEMIKAGFAWHFKKYSSDSILSNLEQQAKANKLGLWIDSIPMEPWQNRKLHRLGISTKGKFNTVDQNK